MISLAAMSMNTYWKQQHQPRNVVQAESRNSMMQKLPPCLIQQRLRRKPTMVRLTPIYARISEIPAAMAIITSAAMRP